MFSAFASPEAIPRKTFLLLSLTSRAFFFIELGDSTSSQVVHMRSALVAAKRRENKNLAEGTSRKKGRTVQKKIWRLPGKVLDEPASQEAMRL